MRLASETKQTTATGTLRGRLEHQDPQIRHPNNSAAQPAELHSADAFWQIGRRLLTRAFRNLIHAIRISLWLGKIVVCGKDFDR